MNKEMLELLHQAAVDCVEIWTRELSVVTSEDHIQNAQEMLNYHTTQRDRLAEELKGAK